MPVHLLTSGGEHEYGAGHGVGGFFVQLPAYGKAVTPGKHKIEDDEIRPEELRQLQPFEAVGSLLYTVAFIFQRKSDKLTDIVVVLDDQDDRLFRIHFPPQFYQD